MWSREGLSRGTLAQVPFPVFGVAWGPDADQLAYGAGRFLSVRSIIPGGKSNEWKAHDATVLTVDWNPISGLLASGGEDRRFKIWDSDGRLVFQSPVQESVITSVAWNPSGDLLAVGSFSTVVLCDKSGWSHCKVRVDTGSLYGISWTADGTQFAAAGGNGAVCFCQLVGEALESGKVRVTLDKPNRCEVSAASHAP